MSGYPDFEPAAPIRVEGGIKARTRRGSIGASWWSRRFVDALENVADSGRLARGRSYARAGQVLDLDVAAYEVRAVVQGSRVKPYEISIGVQAIPDEVWEQIEEALASQAVFRASLLAGDMPPEIEQVFAVFGYSLFPERDSDLSMMCSCPDWGEPCKHVAAALYVLAEAFDSDPFLVLAWHGRTRERLLRNLHSHPVDEAVSPLDGIADVPLEDCVDAFWTPRTRLPDRVPAPRGPADLLLRLLEPPAVVVRGRPLADALRPAYEALNEAAAGTGGPRSGE